MRTLRGRRGRRWTDARRTPHAARHTPHAAVGQDTAILGGTQLIFFAFGWVFFTAKLFRDYEVRQTAVQLAFAFTFSLSCNMFELIIFEILDVLDREYASRHACAPRVRSTRA